MAKKTFLVARFDIFMSTIFCETICERLEQVTNKATWETVPGQMFMFKIKKNYPRTF